LQRQALNTCASFGLIERHIINLLFKSIRCASAAPAGWQLPPVPYALPPAAPQSSQEKNYMFPLDPSRPLSQRKVYVKIHETCQNTAQSMLNCRLVVNGQSTCC